MELGIVVLITGIITTFILFTVLFAIIFSIATIWYFKKTKRILIPRLSMAAIGFVETPLKYILFSLGFDKDFLTSILIELRNKIYWDIYTSTPYENRAVFIPQCLRDISCPAPQTPEGIKCINCGKCGIYALKSEAESRGYKFFIAPGSSLIKRMIKKYRPLAVLGVGCNMEVKEGIESMAKIGLPVQGVKLLSSGCIATTLDVIKFMECLKADKINYSIEDDPEYLEKAREISVLWNKSAEPPFIKVLDKKTA